LFLIFLILDLVWGILQGSVFQYPVTVVADSWPASFRR